MVVSERRCAICRHPQRAEIESMLLEGGRQAEVVRRYEVGREGLRHHIRRHLPGALEKAFDIRELVLARTLLQRAEILHVEACDILGATRDSSAYERVAALNAVRQNLELLGKLSGRLGGASELFVRLGVRDEDQLRQMLQVARSNVNMSVEDHILNGVEIVLAGLPERPEMREEIAAKLEKVLRPTVAALPSHANGNTNGGH